MSRYIDAEWLKIALELYRAVDLSEVPSIDIVRCRECKHWRNDGFCTRPLYSIEYQYMRADDFCSYGEREEREGE